jgi:hypothetical protein
LKNGTTLDFAELAQKKRMKRVPRKAKIERVSINNPSLQRVDSFRNKRDSRTIPHPCISKLGYGDIPIPDGENEERTEGEKAICRSNFRNFYNELNSFRNNINDGSDPYLKDFSVFFRQQKQVSD